MIVIRPDKKTATQKVSLTIDGTNITENDTLKIVGMRISNKLDFKPQIEHLKKEVNRLNGALRRLKYIVNAKTLQRTANATHSQANSYAIMLMANPLTTPTEQMNNNHKELQKMINKTARTVLGKTMMDMIPTKELLEKANFRSVNQIAMSQILKEVWRLDNEQDHPLIKLLKKPNMRTRKNKKGDYRTIGKSKIMTNSIINWIIKVWSIYH